MPDIASTRKTLQFGFSLGASWSVSIPVAYAVAGKRITFAVWDLNGRNVVWDKSEVLGAIFSIIGVDATHTQIQTAILETTTADTPTGSPPTNALWSSLLIGRYTYYWEIGPDGSLADYHAQGTLEIVRQPGPFEDCSSPLAFVFDDGFSFVFSGMASDGLKDNLTATTDPTPADDSAMGYSVGSHWINTTSSAAYILTDASAGVAVWVSITAGAGGGEANTGSSLGGGLPLFDSKAGLVLRFNTLDPGQFSESADVLSISQFEDKIIAASANSDGSGTYLITGANVTLTFTAVDIADANFRPIVVVAPGATGTHLLATEGAEQFYPGPTPTISLGYVGASMRLKAFGGNLLVI